MQSAFFRKSREAHNGCGLVEETKAEHGCELVADEKNYYKPTKARRFIIKSAILEWIQRHEKDKAKDEGMVVGVDLHVKNLFLF